MMMTFCVVEGGVVKCFRERSRAEIVSPRGCYAFFVWTLLRETVELNISKTKKEKKKEKRAAKVVLFNSAMALCFARLSLKTLSFVVAREGKGAALFRTTRVSLYSESESDSD